MRPAFVTLVLGGALFLPEGQGRSGEADALIQVSVQMLGRLQDIPQRAAAESSGRQGPSGDRARPRALHGSTPAAAATYNLRDKGRPTMRGGLGDRPTIRRGLGETEYDDKSKGAASASSMHLMADGALGDAEIWNQSKNLNRISFRTGQDAKVVVAAGPLKGAWVHASVLGPGSRAGTYNIAAGGKEWQDVPAWGLRGAVPTPPAAVYQRDERARLMLPESDNMFPWISVLVVSNSTTTPGSYNVRSIWKDLFNIPANQLRKLHPAA